MNNKFKVGDWVVRRSNSFGFGGVWQDTFPTTFDKPKRVREVGPLGEVDVDGYRGLDVYFTKVLAPNPFREEDYL